MRLHYRRWECRTRRKRRRWDCAQWDKKNLTRTYDFISNIKHRTKVFIFINYHDLISAQSVSFHIIKNGVFPWLNTIFTTCGFIIFNFATNLYIHNFVWPRPSVRIMGSPGEHNFITSFAAGAAVWPSLQFAATTSLISPPFGPRIQFSDLVDRMPRVAVAKIEPRSDQRPKDSRPDRTARHHQHMQLYVGPTAQQPNKTGDHPAQPNLRSRREYDGNGNGNGHKNRNGTEGLPVAFGILRPVIAPD